MICCVSMAIVLALGKSLGVPVLAEGVETEVQRAFLADGGCDEGQGHLMARPVPLDELAVAMVAIVKRQMRTRAWPDLEQSLLLHNV